MKRLIIGIFALALTTPASAMVFSGSGGQGQSYAQQNQDFIGDPLIDGNGVTIGNVVSVSGEPGNYRRIMVRFNDAMPNGYAGWVFNLDSRWRSGGSLEMAETGAQLKAILDRIVATNPGSLRYGN